LIARNGSLFFQARNAISILSAFANVRHTGSRTSAAVLRRVRHIRRVWRRTARRTPKSWSSPKRDPPKIKN